MSAAVARVISMEDHRQSAPQLENGFLRVALEIEDALLLKIDTFRHEKVVRAIIARRKKEPEIRVRVERKQEQRERKHHTVEGCCEIIV